LEEWVYQIVGRELIVKGVLLLGKLGQLILTTVGAYLLLRHAATLLSASLLLGTFMPEESAKHKCWPERVPQEKKTSETKEK
jgi:hypothetical protein